MFVGNSAKSLVNNGGDVFGIFDCYGTNISFKMISPFSLLAEISVGSLICNAQI